MPRRRSRPPRTAAANTSWRAVWALVQPRSGASMTAWSSSPTNRTDSTRPGRSRRGASGSREVGTYSQTATMMTTASGTLARKVAVQSNCSSRSPPATGPSATASPVDAPQTPIARARAARSVKVRIDSVVGNTIAAPTPITARAAISSVVVSHRLPAGCPGRRPLSPARGRPVGRSGPPAHRPPGPGPRR